ncbi:MAG: hypothetical protein MUC92_02035 [Fimbriimonadaceae bacterium]|nr:hypothetical protein [Fimbriimonadaceae bacterium]
MRVTERSENVKEELGSKAFLAIVPGVIALIIGIIMVVYTSRGSAFVGLAWVLVVLGVAAIGYGIYIALQARKVADFPIDCPFCDHRNHLTTKPLEDVRCDGCQRLIPILDGVVLKVFQVRCGFCNHLNYYSEKSTGLICESCDREIPIATDEGAEASKALKTYTFRPDDQLYDLVLVAGGAKQEEIITCLQHMLALNRNQVKQILDETPATLLQGIPRKKAELLKAQIEIHDGKAEFKVTGS